MLEITDQQRWLFRVLGSTMPVLRLLNLLACPASPIEIGVILGINPKTVKIHLANLEGLRFVVYLPDSGQYTAVVELEELLADPASTPPPQEEISQPSPAQPALPAGAPPEAGTSPQRAGITPLPVEEKVFPPGEAVVVVESLKINSIKNLTATTAGAPRGKFFSHPGQPGAFPWLASSRLAASFGSGASPPDAHPGSTLPPGSAPASTPPGSEAHAPPPAEDPPAPPPIPEDIRQALVAAGIGEPKRSQIARLPHITPAYVRAWSAYLVASGKPHSSGLLVYLLEQGDPLPEHAGTTGPDGEFHLKGCKCKFCTWGRLLCPDCLEYPCQCEFVCADCGEDPCTCEAEEAEETAGEAYDPAVPPEDELPQRPAGKPAECERQRAQDSRSPPGGESQPGGQLR